MQAQQISERGFLSFPSVSDRYEIRSLLGRGGNGTAYLADDRDHRQPVVIKVMSGRAHSDSDPAVARFHAEVAATRQLDHPNIVRVLGDGVTADGRPYLVTEWVQGRSLSTVLEKSGPLATGDAIDAGKGIASALAHVHSRGLVHRDLKPSNVIIPGWPEAADYRHPKLVDFGVAGQLNHGVTQPGMIFGTLRYMSPEQIKGEQQSAATDVYGFGLLLFEMLVGHAPENRQRDLATLLIAIREGLPAQELAGLEPDLANLILRCVSLDPGQRPAMTQVLAELSAARRLPAPFPSPTRPIESGSLAPAHTPSPNPVQQLTGRTVALSVKPRRQELVWALQGAVVVLAAGVPMLFFRLHASPSNDALRTVRFAGGLLLMTASIAVGFWLRTWLGSRSDMKSQAYELVFGARARTDLTSTIALQLDELVSKLRGLDERILAGSVALMLNEYGSATDAKDRQAALMNVVALSEKLAVRLSPWYERYKEVIASAVAVMGGVSGLVTAINSVLTHKH